MRVTAVSVFAIALILTVPGLVHSAGFSPSSSKIDPYLQKILEDSKPWDQIELLVQMDGKVKEEDRSFLNEIGIDVKHEFHAIPVFHCFANPSQIYRLSSYQRTFWIEFNEQLEFHMDKTTTVINATRAWNRQILETDGTERSPIDGQGVTVVVLDSGIDAGHPDMDYHDKTILNLKSNTNYGWFEMENADTSSGHGTHCAGTVAGNGDASGEGRRGVAPGANLIGLSTGETLFILNAVGGLEWVYDNTRPGNNPYNIRVVSNSWGSSQPYDREDAVVQLIQKIVYENNVAVCFSAGNSGDGDHDGHTNTVGPYGITPAAINVAANYRNGRGMANFSSRGKSDDNMTWPDLGAPGVSIWSTQARRTLITAAYAQDEDAYYMAISGTSMSCPHVAGAVALLWQACPSMRVSRTRDSYNGNASYTEEEFYSSNLTYIHESELILKLTCRYISPKGENGVPTEPWKGLDNKSYDYAQGYGIIDMDRAIALALTLEELRSKDTSATVWDAYELFENIMVNDTTEKPAKGMYADWQGEWVQFKESGGAGMTTSQVHAVYIPKDAVGLDLVFQYSPIKSDSGVTLGQLDITLDYNGDGQADWTGTHDSITGAELYQLDLSSGEMAGAKGNFWFFDVMGNGFKFQRPNIADPSSNQYREAMVDYAVSTQLRFAGAGSNETVPVPLLNYTARISALDFLEDGETPTQPLSMNRYYYDLSNIYVQETKNAEKEEEVEPFPWFWLLLIAVIAAIAIAYYQYGIKDGSKSEKWNSKPSFVSKMSRKNRK